MPWLQQRILGHVEGLPSDHLTIHSCQLLLPGLSDIESKAAAFILQNQGNEIASALGIPLDRRFNSALLCCRKPFKKKIESHCGGLELYTQNMSIAKARKEYDIFVRDNEEPGDDSMAFLFNGHGFAAVVYAPLRSVNSLYKQAVEEFASEKHHLAYTSAEYIELESRAQNMKKKVLSTRRKKENWMQSFQQGDVELTQISLPVLLRGGVSDKDREAFVAYANCVFYEEQMKDANLHSQLYKSKFWPQSSNLEEYEGYFERVERLSFLAGREELEGVLFRDDISAWNRAYRAVHRYEVERNKTLYLIAKRVLNQDHEVAKMMLNQFKNKVDADEKERERKREKKRIRTRRDQKKLSNINIELNELEEAAFELLKQQTLKWHKWVK